MLPDADSDARSRLLDRQLRALFPIIPICAVATMLTAFWMLMALRPGLPLHAALAWYAIFVVAQTSWASHAVLQMTRRHRSPQSRYTVRDLWNCARWWTCGSAVIGSGLVLCAPYASSESQRMLLVSFVPGLIAAGAMVCMMVPLISAIWLGFSLSASCVAALQLPYLNQITTLVLLLLYAIVLFCGILAISRMFVGRFGAELAAEREKQTAELLAVDLMRQKEISEEAGRAKSSFLAAASHDLRQPVHALSLFVGALRHIPMKPEGRRLVEQIEASTDAMDRLFAALLDISKLDAGIVEVHRRPFPIDTVLSRVCCDYMSEVATKGITLSHVPCRAIIDSDPTLVERIARNLISNAVRYTDAGKIVVGCRRRGSTVAMQVWDTGRGIPPSQHDLVFREYYQLDNPERDREKGLGLGLAIVRRMTSLLKCDLRLHSELGRGSCFEVSIARAEGAAMSQEAADDEVRPTISTGLVVVIDDEHAIRAAMLTLLTDWGYEVLAAESADDAIQRLAACSIRPDLLICDLRLREGKNGIDAIETLRTEYNENIPAMLITGDTAATRLLEAQASKLPVLHKPVPSGKLRAAILQLIAAG